MFPRGSVSFKLRLTPWILSLSFLLTLHRQDFYFATSPLHVRSFPITSDSVRNPRPTHTMHIPSTIGLLAFIALSTILALPELVPRRSCGSMYVPSGELPQYRFPRAPKKEPKEGKEPDCTKPHGSIPTPLTQTNLLKHILQPRNSNNAPYTTSINGDASPSNVRPAQTSKSVVEQDWRIRSARDSTTTNIVRCQQSNTTRRAMAEVGATRRIAISTSPIETRHRG